jgi:Tfp pilus assembly protein PilO
VKLSKEKRDKLVLVGIMTLMVVGLFYTFIIGAQRETLGDLELKASGLRDKVDKAQRLKNLGPRIEQDLADARATLQSKEGGMAPADRNRWFFNIVITYMQEHDVSYETSTPEAIISDTGLFPKFPFQGATYGVKSTGRYHDYGSFVADFENKFPYMRLTQMRLQPALASARSTPGRANAAQTASPEQTGLLTIDTRVMTLVKP